MSTGAALAKAYVQIMPSADGIGAKLGKALGKEMPDAGKSAGKNLGGSLVSALKGVLVTAGIGKAVSTALFSGAELEQSIGGVETLFKESAQTLKARADEAYRTAGLSANAYMELATSFSASLLQSLGGDTQKAADVADMAMTDMSDNANKMGTDMRSIQDAYQGFAKQNYTMLDNLKLGYGGTKTEMQRLLADAEKFSGVKYDIDNLSDVYQAIHVIQGELEISGRTAEEAAEIAERTGRTVKQQLGTTVKEAATTFSGSLTAMKAAFTNVMSKLSLGQDVRPAIKALVETSITFLRDNLLPALGNLFSALPDAIGTFAAGILPQLVPVGAALLESIANGIAVGLPAFCAKAANTMIAFSSSFAQQFPQMLQRGTEIINQIVNGIVQGLPLLINSAVQTLAEFVKTLLDHMPQIIEAGANMLLNLLNGLRQCLPNMLTGAADAVLTMISGLISNYPKILQTGYEMLGKVIAGIINAFPDLVNAALEIVSKIWNTIVETDWLQLGKDIIQGIINGIGAMAGAIWDAAKNMAHNVLNSVKGALDINSPSKVMRDEVGKWIPAGIAQGIERNTQPLHRAMHRAAQEVTGTFAVPLAAMQRNEFRPRGYASAAIGGANYSVTLNQTIHTHDSLSPRELTREAQDLLRRGKWSLP